MIENIIKKAFGIDCKIEKTKLKGIPLYMSAGRQFYLVHVLGMPFLLVRVSTQDRFGSIALEKQLGEYKEKAEMEVAFYFDALTKFQRDTLLSRQIPFIVGQDQIYLPFMGLLLTNKKQKETMIKTDRMMPATQCLFLFLLYNKNADFVLKSQAATALNLTRTSITRASEQLKAMGLLEEEAFGKEIHMKLDGQGLELYKKAKKFLISPVQKILYVEETSELKANIVAGESALSKHSMLSAPQYKTFAIAKNDKLVKTLKTVNPQWQEDIRICCIELWKYNPALFAIDGCVDPISLALSLEENEDERVQGELEIYMEEFEW